MHKKSYNHSRTAVHGIAWRLTATDAPSCPAMLGLVRGCKEDYNRPNIARQLGASVAVNLQAIPLTVIKTMATPEKNMKNHLKRQQN